MTTTQETRCYKHYCRACHAMHFVPAGDAAKAEYPRCCGKAMAYLGFVDAIPGRDDTLRKQPSSPNVASQTRVETPAKLKT